MYLSKDLELLVPLDPYLSTNSYSMIDVGKDYYITGILLSGESYEYITLENNDLLVVDSLRLNLVSNLTSDISYNWGDISNVTIYQNTSKNISIGLTCSISGDTIISYSLKTTNGDEVPSWIQLDVPNRVIHCFGKNTLN